MRRLDLLTARRVGNRPSQIQDAVIGAGREIELAYRGTDETVTRFV